MPLNNPYSERFFLTSSAGTVYWYVPAGYRAIIKHAFVWNAPLDAPHNAGLVIGSAYVWVAVLQAGAVRHDMQMNIVAYPGERLGFWLQAAGMFGYAGGFLITSSAQRLTNDGVAMTKPAELEFDPGSASAG